MKYLTVSRYYDCALRNRLMDIRMRLSPGCIMQTDVFERAFPYNLEKPMTLLFWAKFMYCPIRGSMKDGLCNMLEAFFFFTLSINH